MISIANVELSFRELSAIVGILILFVGTVSVWVEQRIKTRNLERDVGAIRQDHNVCSGAQAERYREILLRTGAIDTKLAEQNEKIDSLYRLVNGKGK